MHLQKLNLFLLGYALLFVPLGGMRAQPVTKLSPSNKGDAYTTTSKNPVGLWHANENSGFTLHDASGNGNNGLLNWDMDAEIGSFTHGSPSSHFSDICYVNSGALPDDPDDDLFLYVYTEYSGFFNNSGSQKPYESRNKAVYIRRDGTYDPSMVTTVYDPNVDDPETYYWVQTGDRIPEQKLDPSCYVFNGTDYVSFTHLQPDLPPAGPRQHIVLYKADKSVSPVRWIRVQTTSAAQMQDESAFRNFLVADLFEFDHDGNGINSLMGIGNYGKERNQWDSDYITPKEAELRVYNFGEQPDSGSGSFLSGHADYIDPDNYIASPDIIKAGNTFYIAYYEAPPLPPLVLPVAGGYKEFNADIKLISTKDFKTYTPSVCVSGNCASNNPKIENKWPAIAMLKDGRLFVAYTSRVAGQLDFIYRTSSPPYNTFSDSYGTIGNGKGEEYYAAITLNSMGNIVLAAQRTTPSRRTENHFMTDAYNWTEGRFGPGLKLDGKADYVNVGNDTSLKIKGNEITVSAWIRAASDRAVGNERIIGKGIAGDSPPYYRYLLYRGDDTRELRFGISTVGASSPSVAIATISGEFRGVTAGTWMHVVGVYDGTITGPGKDNIFIYINGELKGQGRGGNNPSDFNIGDTDEPVVIGANTSVSPPSQFFHGDIDEVMIFNRALDTSEIRSLYTKNSL